MLYELDLRLRPSGNKGPVATHIEAFRKYQREDAWTWEHMALTRARPVAGDAALCSTVEAEVADILARPRDAAKVFRDAAEMRATIAAEKPPRDIWDLKLIPGGQIDLEFVAQCARLTDHIEEDVWPPTSTGDALARLTPDFCAPQVRDELVAAYELDLTLTQAVRLCLTGPLDAQDIPPGLADLLLRSTDLPDIAVLEAHLKETAATVRRHFDTLLASRKR